MATRNVFHLGRKGQHADLGANMDKTKKSVSLSTKWAFAFSFVILLVSGTMAIGLYWQLRTAQRQAFRERLHDILSFATPLVDGDYHSLIRAPEDETSSFYRVVALRLKSIQDTSDVIERIYTLRQQEDGRLTYVVDIDPIMHASVGQDYLRTSPLLEKGLTSIPEPLVEDNLYTDSQGALLSGYAPIYDQFRDLDGVLGIDIDATAVIASEVQARQTTGLAFLASIPLSLLTGWWLARRLTSPVNDLMNGAERVAQGQLDEAIPVRSQDELGVLANVFNRMTTQLRETMRGLEQEIVKHKQAEKIQSVIYRISQATISTDNLEELYPSIQTILGELMPVENFYIALVDPVNDLISFPYYIDQHDEQPLAVKPGRGLTEYVIRTGQQLLATPEVFATLVQQGDVELVGTTPVDWLGAPLIVEGRIIGVMVAQSYSEGIRFNQENLDLFEFVSTQVALMIERKQAAEVLQKSNERYHRLFEDSPISLWEEDFSGVKQILDALRQEGVTDFRSFLGTHPEVVAECAAQVQILDVNKATLVLFRSKTKEDLLKNLASIFCDESYVSFQDELVKIAGGQTEFGWEGVNLTLDGKRIDISIRWSVVPGYERDLSRVIVSMIDITESKKTETKLKHMSIHDALTGLHNRAYFDEEMTQLEGGQQFPISIVMADVDNLKGTNDSEGHPAGDELLRQAAKALKASFRAEDIVARIGGDEFAVLLPGIDATAVQKAILRIKDNIKQQNAACSGPPLSLSLGASTAEKGSSLTEALKQADNQMYIEKSKRSNNPFPVYDS
jgi:diguanylate cyclase (GGDEF)-like protein